MIIMVRNLFQLCPVLGGSVYSFLMSGESPSCLRHLPPNMQEGYRDVHMFRATANYITLKQNSSACNCG